MIIENLDRSTSRPAPDRDPDEAGTLLLHDTDADSRGPPIPGGVRPITGRSRLFDEWMRRHDARPDPSATTRRCVYYCRYSTSGQTESSIARQIANNDAYAKRLGFIPAAGHDRYIDRARTGAYTFGREALARLLADAGAGMFDIVVVEDLDRLSRDIGDLGRILRTLESNGVELHAATRGRCGNMEVAMIGFLSSEQRLKIAQITTQGRWLAAAQGRVPSKIAYGYKRSQLGPGIHERDDAKAKIVERIFDLFDRGMSIGNIVALLNREGKPSPRDRLWTHRLLAGSARKGSGILRNPKYAGLLVFGRIERRKQPDDGRFVTRIRHPSSWIVCEDPSMALVDPDLWSRVQDKLDAPGKKRPRKAGLRGEYIFKGVTFCTCGAPMYGIHLIKNRPRQLVCSAARVGACKSGAKRTITAHFVERELLRIVRDDIAGVEASALFEAEYLAERDRIARKVVVDRAALEKSIAELERRIERTYDDSDSGLTRERVAKIRAKFAAELTAREIELERLPHLDRVPKLQMGDVLDFRAAVADLIGRLPLTDIGETELVLYQALRSLVRSVVIRFEADGGYTLVVQGHLVGLIGDAPTGVEPSRDIVRRCPAPSRGFMTDPDRRDRLTALAAAGEWEVSEDDWAAVAPLLGTRRKDALSQRTALNAALFHAQTRVPIHVLPRSFGAPAAVGNAIRKLIREGAMNRVLDVLEERKSPVVESLDRAVFDRWAAKPRRRSRTAPRRPNRRHRTTPRSGRTKVSGPLAA